MSAAAEIAALKQRIRKELDGIEEQHKRLTAEYEAAELLEKRALSEQAERQLPLQMPTAATAGAPTVTFAESVRRAIAEFKDSFTVKDVENMLRSMGVTLPQNNLRPRIAGEIKGEITRNNVLLVQKGSGHVPHRYRRLVKPIPETERAPMRGAPSVQH